MSGDSSGSTQFWDGQLGTLLQVHTRHRADVLALAASPSHRTVFAGGADGQVGTLKWDHMSACILLPVLLANSSVHRCSVN